MAADSRDVFRKKRTAKLQVVGLELDPTHLAVAAVSPDGSFIERGAYAELAPGVMRDGELADPAALAQALGSLFADTDLPRRVRLGIADRRIVVRALDLPGVPEDDAALDAAVRTHAPDHIPMPMDEAVLDFQRLGVVAGPFGPQQRVVVVAARREAVERIAGAVQAAELELEGIDLSAFGMVRALASDGDACLYVNVAGLVNVAVASDGDCLFTRAAAGGLQKIAEDLAASRGLTLEHAHQWMQHVGLVASQDAIDGDPLIVAAARAALDRGVAEVADSVRSSLNFYRAQENSEVVARGVVTGPATALPGFTERLGELLGLELETQTVPAADGLDAGRLSVAAGLAVAERA